MLCRLEKSSAVSFAISDPSLHRAFPFLLVTFRECLEAYQSESTLSFSNPDALIFSSCGEMASDPLLLLGGRQRGAAPAVCLREGRSVCGRGCEE